MSLCFHLGLTAEDSASRQELYVHTLAVFSSYGKEVKQTGHLAKETSAGWNKLLVSIYFGGNFF